MHTRSSILFAIPLVVLFLITAVAQAQTAREWAARATEHYHAGRFPESADAYGHAIEAGGKSRALFYNAACSAALAGRIDSAFELLEDAVEHGWRDVGHLLADDDLEVLHRDSRWNDLVTHVEQAEVDYIESLPEPDLYRELLEMQRLDQASRRGEPLLELSGRTTGEIDAANTARMKEIIEEHGWPTKSLVGADGAQAAWLLVQHADADPPFQRHCLGLMNAAESGEVDPVDVAYLTDRILVNEGKKQIYGTQFWSPEGELIPRPIEDEARVEELRAEIGMISMQEYHRRMTGRDWVPDAGPMVK